MSSHEVGSGGSTAARRETVISADAQRPQFDNPKPSSSHHEKQTQTPPSQAQPQQRSLNTNQVEEKLSNLRRPGEVLVRQTKDDGTKETWRVVTPAASRAAAGYSNAAQNYDEAPPGQPGPDFSATKPAFTRGISAFDNTAVVSAGPTPAAELANPMVFVKGTGGSRARESHLPDLDLRDADVYKGDAFSEEPTDEISGEDAFAPSVARGETDDGKQGGGQTAGVDGWGGTN